MNDFPEAPASVTYSIVSKDGYPSLFTVRAESGTDLLEKMMKIELTLIAKGYKPQVKQAFGQKKELVYAEHPCPMCGKRVVVSETKNGKVEKCETQKYDFQTKSTSGCAYTKWL